MENKSKVPTFSERVRRRASDRSSWLCVGIDPDPEKLPAHLPRDAGGVVEFCREIIDATRDYAAAFKIQFAFFEALGPEGWSALGQVRDFVPDDVPVIADAKRGDISNTSRAYARAIFDELRFDAVTVNPYMGWEAIRPFLEYGGRGVLVLCRTSNPGATDFQELIVGDRLWAGATHGGRPPEGSPLYMHVAQQALAQQSAADIGLVAGATAPEALVRIRSLSQDLLLLVPGVGPQGRTPRQAFELACNARRENALINVSREIIYATDARHFGDAAATAASLAAQEIRTAPSGAAV